MSDACIERNVCPAYLLEPTPGTQCPLASGLGTNTFSASLPLAQVLAQSNFATKWLTWKLPCNLVTMISAARDLNEHGGKASAAADIVLTYVQTILKSSKCLTHPMLPTLEK